MAMLLMMTMNIRIVLKIIMMSVMTVEVMAQKYFSTVRVNVFLAMAMIVRVYVEVEHT